METNIHLQLILILIIIIIVLLILIYLSYQIYKWSKQLPRIDELDTRLIVVETDLSKMKRRYK